MGLVADNLKGRSRATTRALIQMTMGAGKTLTACTASYRSLAYAGVRPMLFLGAEREFAWRFLQI